ncbi:hypothetical protein ACFV27_36950 [Streptomyces antimycoticus]|uniref:hypothetical protein n=1 Tax=Streptomyces antimycoticus TaxID=68175 RepID=UPI00367B31C9
MTDEARAQLLNRLKAAQRARMARRGDLGPVVHALYQTANLMDADDRGRERRVWKEYAAGEHPRPITKSAGWGQQDPAQILAHYGFLAAYGLNSMDQWQQVRRAYTAPGGAGHKAWMAWVLKGRAVRAEMEKLLLPLWVGSPSLTAADVRAIADRVAAETA